MANIAIAGKRGIAEVGHEGRELEAYDFNYPKHIDRDVLARPATLDFVREKTSVVFIGPSVVGKTHLANAAGQLARLRGYRIRSSLPRTNARRCSAATACSSRSPARSRRCRSATRFDLPVVVMSGAGDVKTEAHDLAADGYLLEPFDADALDEAIAPFDVRR